MQAPAGATEGKRKHAPRDPAPLLESRHKLPQERQDPPICPINRYCQQSIPHLLSPQKFIGMSHRHSVYSPRLTVASISHRQSVCFPDSQSSLSHRQLPPQPPPSFSRFVLGWAGGRERCRAARRPCGRGTPGPERGSKAPKARGPGQEHLSTFDHRVAAQSLGQLMPTNANDTRVKDCPVGYQLRILVINVSTVPDRPKPP